MSVVKEGSHVVIVDNSGNRRVQRVKAGKRLKHFKVLVDLAQLIGADFGTHFQVKDPKSGDLQAITDVRELTQAFLEAPATEEAAEEEEVKTPDKDNRDIVDNNQA
jgi:hypothetical protein